MSDLIPSLENPFHTTAEVAVMFGVKEQQVREWIRDGKMAGHKILGRWRVQHSECIRVANEEHG